MMKKFTRPLTFGLLALLALSFVPEPASAETASHGHDAVLSVFLLTFGAILFAGRLGGTIILRFGLPEVLGELLVGIIIGNLFLLGIFVFEPLKTNEAVQLVSQLGVIFLLFEAGLETDIEELVKVGWMSLSLALVGIVAPVGLGILVSYTYYPDASVYKHLFLGATLAATSIGITARILKDLGMIKEPMSRIVLGAAVMDDVLALILLGTITSLAVAADAGVTLHYSVVITLFLKSSGFLLLTILLGRRVLPFMLKLLGKLQSTTILISFSFVLCFLLSYLASVVQLAPVVGAFTAGLVIGEISHRNLPLAPQLRDLEGALEPILALFLPVFFVLIGLQVQLDAISGGKSILFAIAVILAAIVGKVAGGLFMNKKLPRLAIGLSMVPRGEITLIFAAVGGVTYFHGEPLIGPDTFVAIVLMVVVTSFASPPSLAWSLRNYERSEEAEAS